MPRMGCMELADRFGRVATDLRVSLTDRCNLRCSWCDTAQAFYGGKRMLRGDVLAQSLALGTPLGLRQQHTERKVDVILEDGARLVYDMDSSAERAVLADQVSSGKVASLQTREFNFHEAFLKLTGTEFS